MRNKKRSTSSEHDCTTKKRDSLWRDNFVALSYVTLSTRIHWPVKLRSLFARQRRDLGNAMTPLDETKLHSFIGRHIDPAAQAQRATHYKRESGMPLPFHDLLSF
ncbi:hypothetical protein ACFVTJ_19690 [Agrobacterium sp. NPDC058088]|uniref:hypothetical protein n=1 Tax=Agrobacterium sp. NPDC058088 TaxID=3346335 RepID=UPI0036DB784B